MDKKNLEKFTHKFWNNIFIFTMPVIFGFIYAGIFIENNNRLDKNEREPYIKSFIYGFVYGIISYMFLALILITIWKGLPYLVYTFSEKR